MHSVAKIIYKLLTRQFVEPVYINYMLTIKYKIPIFFVIIILKIKILLLCSMFYLI